MRVTSRLALAMVVAACNSTAPRPAVVEPPPRKAQPAQGGAPTVEAVKKPGIRVLIISEDGMRPDALTPQTAPNHVALMHESVIARRAYTVIPSETLASHASMLSGFAPSDHKMNFDRFDKHRGQIELPTIFSIAREHGLSTAMFIGKQKLWHIAPTASVDHYEKPGFPCRTVAGRAAPYFEAHLPDLMFVHFTDPDNAGHGQGWMSPAYIAAVKEADRCLRTMLDAIDRSNAAATTLVILTADHGGSGRSHSGHGKELDRRIPWIMRGVGVRPGSMIDADVMTEDTAVTALSALGLPTRHNMIGVSWYPVPANLVRDAPAAMPWPAP
jgi:arylsulfatase A-like enzyme